MGKDRARKAVWQFVGPNTVVVGHSAHNDLTALRWIHPVVVDTFLIESTKAKNAKAEEKKETDSPTTVSINVAKKANEHQQPRHRRAKGSGPLSLKTLAKVRLGREIQTGGRKGHDSLEDAIAARDLAHWNVVNKDRSNL
jgi:RNA exonuclease 1